MTSHMQQRLPGLPAPFCADLAKEIISLVRIMFVAEGATCYLESLVSKVTFSCFLWAPHSGRARPGRIIAS